MPASLAQRWAFTQPSPLGEVRSSYELTAEGLQFQSDAALGGGAELLRWDSIAQAATAVADLPVGSGGPDLPRWVPGRIEWLVVARSGAGPRAFMRPLPSGDTRDAIVAALRERLGGRWIGERLALPEAQQRFGLGAHGETLKVAGLVLSVLGVLFALLLLAAALSAVLLLPAVALLGAWCFHRGVGGLRDALQIANTPTARVSSAALGLVELEGRAIGGQPSPAGASGVPSLWWDVVVDVWYDGRDSGGWRQVMARHGGHADLLVLEDATGRVPVWLRDADLLLEPQVWESDRDPLPAAGIELLAGTAFAWNSGKRLRVRETRIEANGPVYVIGTLDEARHLPATGDEGALSRGLRALRTGAWRGALLRLLPALLRAPVGVAIAYLDLLLGMGRGGERAQRPQDAPPPALDASAMLVWKGRAGRPLIVSNRHETGALAQLRRRSLVRIALGVAILCACLHEFIQLF